jgi:hypothetical protein
MSMVDPIIIIPATQRIPAGHPISQVTMPLMNDGNAVKNPPFCSGSVTTVLLTVTRAKIEVPRGDGTRKTRFPSASFPRNSGTMSSVVRSSAMRTARISPLVPYRSTQTAGTIIVIVADPCASMLPFRISIVYASELGVSPPRDAVSRISPFISLPGASETVVVSGVPASGGDARPVSTEQKTIPLLSSALWVAVVRLMPVGASESPLSCRVIVLELNLSE